MTLGQRIRARREELGMTQTELSQKLGFKSRSSLNKIEMDVHAPKQKMIKAIADALETDVLYILGISEEAERQEKELCKLFKMCHGSDAFDVVQNFLKLDPSDRQTVSLLIQSMLANDKYKKAASSARMEA